MNSKIEAEKFERFLRSLTPEQIAEGNRIEMERADRDHKEFTEAFAAGQCSLCGKPLASFSSHSPCLHWLLKPKGFKKKHIKSVVEKSGYHNLEAYLRWVANTEALAININDLDNDAPDIDGEQRQVIAVTIKYKELEGSISCRETDLAGHETSQHARHPHFHLQMRVAKQPFINYSDFHLPFSEYDLTMIATMRRAPDMMRRVHGHGSGMSTAMEVDPELVINLPGNFDVEESRAGYQIHTMMMAEEGKTLRGEDLYNIIQKAKANKVSVASLAHEVPGAQVSIVVEPGAGVVEPAPRSSGRGKRDAGREKE